MLHVVPVDKYNAAKDIFNGGGIFFYHHDAAPAGIGHHETIEIITSW